MAIKLAGVQLGNITGGPSSLNLYELHDVSIVSPATGQYLRYNSVISEWQNAFIESDIYGFLNTNMSGSNGVLVSYTPGPNTINVSLNLTASGDVAGSVVTGNLPLTLATVNADVGTYGSSTDIPVVTVNAKGLVTAVTTTSFTGTAPLATSLAGGSAGTLPYQSAPSTTSMLTVGTSSQVLVSGSAPSWTNTPTLTGTNFTGIPNAGLTNNSLTIGSTNIALGATGTTLAGLTSVTSTTFVGALTGNATTATTATTTTGNAGTATTLQTSRSISTSGDATWTVSFDGTSNVSAAITLATVNATPGQFAVSTTNAKGLVTTAANLSGDITSSGAVTTLATVNVSPQSDTFRKVTVNGKGLTTATSAVIASDITTSLGFTPVDRAGDTMTGLLVLSGDPVAALGAATKQYVDTVAAGLNVHPSCITATTATLASSSGGTVTYNNGAAGVGATLTTTGTFTTIGGTSVANGNRVLVKDEATQANNGIYSRTSATVLTRTADFDNSPDGEVEAGDFTFISSGTLAGTNWAQLTPSPIVIGTTSIVFSQLSGPGVYVSGTGINISSNIISNTGVLSNIAGTGISVSGATGNVTVTNTGVTSAIAGTNISVSAATGAVTFSVTGTVPTATTATNLSGGLAGSHPYQTGAGTTAMLAAGTSSQVLVSGATPAWTNTPTLTGTNFTGIPNAGLTNSSVTIGSTNVALGATSTTLAGLTSITSTTFVGAVTGNASTATTLQTARNINGVSFNGSADITVTAAAGTLTGSTLNAGVTASSLTSVGTLGTLTVTGTIIGNGGINLLTANAGIELGSNTSNTPFIDFHSSANNIDYDARIIASGGTASPGTGTLSLIAGNVSASLFTGALSGNATTATTSSTTNALSATCLGTTNIWTGSSQNFTSAASTPVGTSGQLGSLVAYSNAGAAGMSFHRPGAYAINFGMDTDNVVRMGGWSDGASVYRMQIDTSGNFYTRGSIQPQSSFITRNTHSTGYLMGGYNNIGPSEGKTNPIFAIGTSYAPSDTALNSMYGIGYSNTFGPSGYSGWGLYVASAGVARIGLGSDTGNGYFAGDVIAYASDNRLKTNIKTIENALDKVSKIRGVEYDWLDGIEESHDFHPSSKHETGVIAQEIQEVIPDAVCTAPFNRAYTQKHGIDENFLTVDKEKIVPLLIEAIKELNAKVDGLQAELKALKG